MLQLFTRRLRLIALDTPLLHLLQNSRALLESALELKESGRQLSVEEYAEMQDALQVWVEGARKHPEAYGLHSGWEIIWEATNQSVGNIGLSDLNEAGQIMVGYSIDERFRNKGVASEALGTLAHWVFQSRNKSCKYWQTLR